MRGKVSSQYVQCDICIVISCVTVHLIYSKWVWEEKNVIFKEFRLQYDMQMRCEVLKTVNIKITLVWNVTPSNLIEQKHVGRNFLFHLQERSWRQQFPMWSWCLSIRLLDVTSRKIFMISVNYFPFLFFCMSHIPVQWQVIFLSSTSAYLTT